MRTTEINLLKSEYDSLNNWKDIYQWSRVKSVGNTEIISEWLINDFFKIQWNNVGLRSQNFKCKDHDGLCYAQTSITQFTEKRFCRALFNEFNVIPNNELGLFLDYEIPLTERGQKDKVNQGEIDLLSEKENQLLFIEAKKANSNESLLKAILEIFVYVSRLSRFGILYQFLCDYGKQEKKVFIPCILTFNNATSGKQITNINKFPNLLILIDKINTTLKSNIFKELEFYIIEKPENNFTDLLKTEESHVAKQQCKILLNGEIHIKQHFLYKH